MSQRMPYQCMAKLGNIVVSARGSRIDSFTLPEGAFLSTWSSSTLQEEANGKPEVKPTPILQNSESSSVDITLDAAPPAKKRRLSKVSREEEEADEKEPGKEGKKKKNNRSDAVVSGLEAPAIIALAVTKDGKHVVAVTGEDKSIRVFESVSEDEKQSLKQLSQRVMPKRPCAITITKDSKTIISADKFGDVYSLPLVPSPTTPENILIQTPEPTVAPKPFIPAANELTIHSERNRRALENQRRQTSRPVEKIEPSFEHRLLLGHVSMLTDVILAEHQGRDYILTADRDEHIRVSRGIPQTHVIEGFCLGHEEFVSRLCIPSSRPEILISGGGDDKLFVWEWLTGRLVSTVDIASYIKTSLVEAGTTSSIKPAISSIQHIQIFPHEDLLFVASEGVPAIFIFSLSSAAQLVHRQTLMFAGNVLSIVASTQAGDAGLMLLVSIDILCKPGSTIERRTEPLKGSSIEKLVYVPEKETFSRRDFVSEIEAIENEVPVTDKVGNLLYNLENLRKREGGDGEGGEE